MIIASPLEPSYIRRALPLPLPVRVTAPALSICTFVDPLPNVCVPALSIPYLVVGVEPVEKVSPVLSFLI